MSLNANGDYISEDSFMDDYRPIVQTGDGDYLIPDLASVQAKIEQAGLTSEHVWTIMEDEGSLFASPGFHIVNRIGYVITENPAQSDVMDAIWHDATDEDSMGFDVNDDDDDDEGPRITAG